MGLTSAGTLLLGCSHSKLYHEWARIYIMGEGEQCGCPSGHGDEKHENQGNRPMPAKDLEVGSAQEQKDQEQKGQEQKEGKKELTDEERDMEEL
jgi:hypothetical protein